MIASRDERQNGLPKGTHHSLDLERWKRVGPREVFDMAWAEDSSGQKRMEGLRQAGLGPHPLDGFPLPMRIVCLSIFPGVLMLQ